MAPKSAANMKNRVQVFNHLYNKDLISVPISQQKPTQKGLVKPYVIPTGYNSEWQTRSINTIKS